LRTHTFSSRHIIPGKKKAGEETAKDHAAEAAVEWITHQKEKDLQAQGESLRNGVDLTLSWS